MGSARAAGLGRCCPQASSSRCSFSCRSRVFICVHLARYGMDLNLMMASFLGKVNLIPAKRGSSIVYTPERGRLPDADTDETLCGRSESLHHDTSAARWSRGIQERILGRPFVEDAVIVESGSNSRSELPSNVLNISAEPMPEIGQVCIPSRSANDPNVLIE